MDSVNRLLGLGGLYIFVRNGQQMNLGMDGRGPHLFMIRYFQFVYSSRTVIIIFAQMKNHGISGANE